MTSEMSEPLNESDAENVEQLLHALSVAELAERSDHKDIVELMAFYLMSKLTEGKRTGLSIFFEESDDGENRVVLESQVNDGQFFSFSPDILGEDQWSEIVGVLDVNDLIRPVSDQDERSVTLPSEAELVGDFVKLIRNDAAGFGNAIEALAPKAKVQEYKLKIGQLMQR